MPPHPQGGRQGVRLLRPDGGREERARRRVAPALLDEGASGEPASQRGWPLGHQGRHRGAQGVAGRQGFGRPRDRLPPGARADAGFHRRSRRRRPRGHARRHQGARRRSPEDQPAGAGRPRHRPFGDRRRGWYADGLRPQCRARIRAQRRALPLPEMGTAGVPEFPCRAARHRHLPPGESRISRPDCLDEGRGRRHRRLSRHLRGHRFAHHHDQRPGRTRLGRRRHRGGSRHARPAGVDAPARGRRLQADRLDEGRRDRDRSRADRRPDAAQEGRRGQVRRVLRRGPRLDDAGRPCHDRQHGSGIRRDLRLLPGR